MERAEKIVMTGIRKLLSSTRLYAEVRYFYRSARIILSKGKFLHQEFQGGEFTWELLPESQRKYDPLFQDSSEQFASIIRPFTREFTWQIGRVYNAVFMSQDVELLYSIVRHFRSKLVIEIGSGHSTSFVSQAMSRNGVGRILSIDPVPRRSLPKRVESLKMKMEDVSRNVYTSLEAGDILFIDAWHTREIANYYTQHILPLLKSGVLIHIHDVAYPYQQAYEEELVVLDYFHNHQSQFNVLTGCSFVAWKTPKLVSELLPAYRWCTSRPGTSLWAMKR